MHVVVIDGRHASSHEYSSASGFLGFLHNTGERYLSSPIEHKRITTDMDGVLIRDDNAIAAARIISGPQAVDTFGMASDLNIRAVEAYRNGGGPPMAYCWYAPTKYVGELLKDLSPEINRAIGRHMRLVPDSQSYIDCLGEMGFDITAVTAGHQEAAEAVSERLGIERTIGTRFGITGGAYDGTVQEFAGGEHKLGIVKKLLYFEQGYIGNHIGDSWSDVETLDAIPHSVCFNPGCEPAARAARISVIGTSQMSLLPLYDIAGRYDGLFSGDEKKLLPDAVLVVDNSTGHDANLLSRIYMEFMACSRECKQVMADMVEGERAYHEVEESARRELRELGVLFEKPFQPVDMQEFDACAKRSYAEFCEKVA